MDQTCPTSTTTIPDSLPKNPRKLTTDKRSLALVTQPQQQVYQGLYVVVPPRLIGITPNVKGIF